MGGTITASTLSGGTVIESAGIALAAWDGILGYPGRDGEDAALLGRDGAKRLTKQYRPRILTIQFLARDRSATGTITTTDGRRYELESNLDGIKTLVDGGGGTVLLERDIADGTGGTATRWIELEAVEASSPITRGPIFGSTHSAYQMSQVFRGAYPFWQSETLNSQVLTAGGSPNAVVNDGNARVSNASLAFVGNAVVTHDTNGDTVEIAGSTGASTVDIGASTIKDGSNNNVDNWFEPPAKPYWLRLDPGSNPLTITGSNVTISYRDHWL